MPANHRLSRGIAKGGQRLSAWVANAAAEPLTQAGLIGFCAMWWVFGLPTEVLTATLSILAITLTQMVLNRQKIREEVDHRREMSPCMPSWTSC